MKIKSNLYCIADKNNKPDFRFLFQTSQDAQKKIKQIKNSTSGETLFYSPTKREFFIDGVKKKMLSPEKRVSIKRGCWSGLKVKKLELVDAIEPKRFFQKTVADQKLQFSYSQEKYQPSVWERISPKIPPLSKHLSAFDWDSSFLHTKSFASGLAVLLIATFMSMAYISNRTSAQIAEQVTQMQSQTNQKMLGLQTSLLAAKEQENNSSFDENLNKFVMETLKTFTSLRQEEFTAQVQKMLAGSPMEKMTPYIVQQDRTVAAFLIGIAKKESNWGQRVPVLNGQDCFNYWGYRGIRDRMGTGGHTCFDSPEDAVDTVAGRIQELVKADIDTPKEMVLWKCGSACHQDGNASQWINDVSLYFNKVEDLNRTDNQDNG